MQTFAPVWLSSRSHLRAFAAPYHDASWFSRYVWPPAPAKGFPQIRVGWRASPLVLFATGELQVDGDLVTFAARDEPAYRNTYIEYDFQVQLDRRTGIERYFWESPILARYTLPWIALRSPDLEEELLLCVGGPGPALTRINEATEALFRILQDAKAGVR